MCVCMSPGAVRTYTIVSTYDYNLGISTCEQVETTTLRTIKSYFDRPVSSMDGLVRDLDMSVTVLRMREIAAKLLAEGNLNLHKDAEDIEDWLRVLRLVVFSESRGTVDGTYRADGKMRFLFMFT